MTHSLHRRGSEEDLQNDYIILVTSAYGYNHEGTRDKFIQVLDAVFEAGPDNLGSNETGTIYSGVTLEEIKEHITDVPRVRCCFASKDKMFQVIRKIHEMDLGLSVVISGLIDNVLDMAKELDIKPHSVNLSLQIWGNVESLPPEDVLEVVTMCGHGLVASGLVEKYLNDVSKGKISPRKAAEKVAHPCVCGFFNPDRAEKIFEKYAPK
ncbi:MAG: hypothetical protein RBR71_06655 [Gudongella sp.]|nr:hypothetical protein [Gudongella sp.]